MLRLHETASSCKQVDSWLREFGNVMGHKHDQSGSDTEVHRISDNETLWTWCQEKAQLNTGLV